MHSGYRPPRNFTEEHREKEEKLLQARKALVETNDKKGNSKNLARNRTKDKSKSKDKTNFSTPSSSYPSTPSSSQKIKRV
jgi:hypothetical protein